MTTSYTYKLIEAVSKTWYQTESVFLEFEISNYSHKQLFYPFFYGLSKYSFQITMINIHSKCLSIIKL